MRNVSILVLLEVPLQRYTDGEDNEIKKGFNPCFTGSTSSTVLEVILLKCQCLQDFFD